MTEAIAKASAEGAEEQQLAWDDLRRMARLYDTGIRKVSFAGLGGNAPVAKPLGHV
jgi:hypothetical protein